MVDGITIVAVQVAVNVGVVSLADTAVSKINVEATIVIAYSSVVVDA